MSGSTGDDERTRIVPPPPPPPPPAQHGNALTLGFYLGEFELTAVIGEGGFGIVYDAWDHSLQRRVAVKEYMPASLASREGTQVQVRSARYRETFEAGLKSFVNEARLLAQFDNPSLVKVYRFWEANGTAYMVMPLYQGATLKDRLREMLKRGTPPDEAWLMNLLAPLTEALGVIHAENCYHRDIAPDNIILLAGSERPLLLDFGAARRVIGDMTQALTVILKPGYAPVEQYAETPNMKQGAWTDVYALAATVHWAILGKTPPPSVSRLMSDGYVSLVQAAAGRYSPTFLHALDRALRVRPDERTQNITELRAEMGLDAWALSQPVTRVRTVQPVHVAPIRSAPPSDFAPTRSAAPSDFAPARFAPPPRQAAPVDFELSDPPAPPAPPQPAAFGLSRSRRGLVVGAGLGVLALAVLAWVTIGGSPSKAPSPSAAAPAPPPPAPTPTPAPAPTPSPPPAPVAAATFEIQQEFDKVLAAQTAGFDVSAKSARQVLRVGRDKLSFEITSSRDGFVHVLLLGPDRSLTLFYPNSTAGDHRIKAGQRLVLPQANWPLLASEPVGPEHFLVVVSQHVRDYGDLVKGSEYIFKTLHTGAQAAAVAARWPAGTPALLGSARGCTAGADCDSYGAALFSIDVTR